MEGLIAFTLSSEAQRLASKAAEDLSGKRDPEWIDGSVRIKLSVYDWSPSLEALKTQLVNKDLVCTACYHYNTL